VLDPELPAAQVAVARSLRTTGGAAASIPELEAALERHPHPDEAHRELALSHERVGDLRAAEDSLRAATAAGPDDWRNWNLLGALLWKLGRYEEAGSAFGRAADVAPGGVSRPRENLVAVEVSLGRFEAAIEAAAGLPEPIASASLASNVGTAYYFSERPDKWERAEHYYRLAVRLNPGNDGARRNLGDLLVRLGRPEDAREQYRAALDIVAAALSADPGDPSLRLRRAHYAARLGRCADALSWAEELAVAVAPAAETAHELALSFVLCGDREGAIAQLRRAVELGFPPELAGEEEEFRPLAGDPEYERLISPRRDR